LVRPNPESVTGFFANWNVQLKPVTAAVSVVHKYAPQLNLSAAARLAADGLAVSLDKLVRQRSRPSALAAAACCLAIKETKVNVSESHVAKALGVTQGTIRNVIRALGHYERTQYSKQVASVSSPERWD
jgi:transcription initiation factor TFIIIB Brf1 subunit/transcription initiation factor TFIIB